jgi:hypothetical protein
MAKKTETLIRWTYEENVTAEEFIARLAPLVCEATSNLREMDGDMFVSDYRNLCEAAGRLSNAVAELRKEEAE